MKFIRKVLVGGGWSIEGDLQLLFLFIIQHLSLTIHH